MDVNHELVRVFITGGILSPADMKKIVETAKELGTEYIHFGSRQDMLFPIRRNNKARLKSTFEYIQTEYNYNELVHHNIVTSYIAEGILPTTPWLHIDIYHYIIQDIDFRPKLKINITDPKQTLVPLFSGQLNFVASEVENYWYLYLRFSEDTECLDRWPVLVSNEDIPPIAAFLDAFSDKWSNQSIPELFELVNENLHINNRNIDSSLRLPEGVFPYYEGFHKMDGDSYWLGLYWRNNKYDIEFISHLCDMCLSSNTGQQIIITPWKSFIVKNIKWRDRLGWEKLLGKFGINIRHSSLELNWHLPLLDRNALDLKQYLVKVFDQNDINTYGLTFTVKTKPMVLFTSVVIEQNRTSKFAHRYALVNTFNILYSKDFNPNSIDYITYASDVEREDLAPLLMEISKLYYEQLDYSPANTAHQPISEEQPLLVHQCKNCLTIYSEQYSNPDPDMKKSLPFDELPQDYRCPVCDAPKSDYITTEFTPHQLA